MRTTNRYTRAIIAACIVSVTRVSSATQRRSEGFGRNFVRYVFCPCSVNRQGCTSEIQRQIPNGCWSGVEYDH